MPAWGHGQYRTLKVEYLLPMPAFTKSLYYIISDTRNSLNHVHNY